MDPLSFVTAKVKNQGVKTVSIVTECEKLDRNKDGLIHSDDLFFILNDLMGDQPLSRREARYLIQSVTNDKNASDIEYNKLYRVLDAKKSGKGAEEEKWFDAAGTTDTLSSSLRFSGRTLNMETLSPGRLSSSGVRNFNPNTTSSRSDIEYAPRGSIGSWLEKSACPIEIKNFKKFIHALEKYERDSGMHVEDEPNGFVVPLGPDLKVKMEFRID